VKHEIWRQLLLQYDALMDKRYQTCQPACAKDGFGLAPGGKYQPLVESEPEMAWPLPSRDWHALALQPATQAGEKNSSTLPALILLKQYWLLTT
jgi:hypothetical protein